LRDATTGLNMTRTGATMGTPAFMAPEQARGDVSNIDLRTDIWAAGATLFTALSGQLVHEGENARQVMLRAATIPARSLSNVMPDAPSSVVRLLTKALEFEKDSRWPTAAAMRDAIVSVHVEMFGEPRHETLQCLFDNLPDIAQTEAMRPGTSIQTIAESAVESVSSSQVAVENFAVTSADRSTRSLRSSQSRRVAILVSAIMTLLLVGAFALRSARHSNPTNVRAPKAGTLPEVVAAKNSIPALVKGQNPFAGVRLYVNAYSAAATQAKTWQSSRPDAALLLQKIATQPAGWWIGESSGNPELAVRDLGSATNGAGVVPVLVIYNIPNRDCGQYSKGGSASTQAYRSWIRGIAKGAASYRMIVVLEPDALAMLTNCLAPADQTERLSLIRDAVGVLEATPGLSVYIDAGHPRWVDAGEMAVRLNAAGVQVADGFALNVANYVATDSNIAYGHAISAGLGGKHFIVDTGRNGNGATFEAAWCNPKGRALGTPPTTNTGDESVDAFFWVKPPGDSDGECNGGPKAGQFWPEQALSLARSAKWSTPESVAKGSVEVP